MSAVLEAVIASRGQAFVDSPEAVHQLLDAAQAMCHRLGIRGYVGWSAVNSVITDAHLEVEAMEELTEIQLATSAEDEAADLWIDEQKEAAR